MNDETENEVATSPVEEPGVLDEPAGADPIEDATSETPTEAPVDEASPSADDGLEADDQSDEPEPVPAYEQSAVTPVIGMRVLYDAANEHEYGGDGQAVSPALITSLGDNGRVDLTVNPSGRGEFYVTDVPYSTDRIAKTWMQC